MLKYLKILGGFLLHIEKIPVDHLIPDPNNARKHDEKNISAIKGSLAKFGQQKPIVIDKKNVVLAGNGTLEGAKSLGWSHIECVRSKLETNTDKVAYALADNRSSELASWDDEVLGKELHALFEDGFEIEEIGFDPDDFSLEPEGNDGLTDPDEVPQVEENKFGVKRGDVWLLGDHRVMCGDSTEKVDVDRLMDGEKADMVFTDPPYGVSYTDKNEWLNGLGAGHRLTKPIENDHETVDGMYSLWCKTFNLIGENMSKKSSFYICSPQGGELMMMMQAVDQSPLSLKHSLIWIKNNHVLGRCDYNYKHEPILYGWLKKGTHKFYGKGECKTSVWPFDKPLKNDLHPTMKPVALVEEALLNSSVNGDVTFEPFAGSGSTLIACEKTGRKCLGMEIDPHYCSVIIQRWQDFTGKEAKRG